jgi:hypothetical protein
MFGVNLAGYSDMLMPAGYGATSPVFYAVGLLNQILLPRQGITSGCSRSSHDGWFINVSRMQLNTRHKLTNGIPTSPQDKRSQGEAEQRRFNDYRYLNNKI